MLKNINTKLLALYLALGPIIWFATFSLGSFKRVLLILVILSFASFFKPGNIKSFLFFLVIYILIIISLFATNTFMSSGLSQFLIGVLGEYIFFVIGYNIAKTIFFYDNKYSTFVVLLPLIASLLTISNFAIGVPNWTVPGEDLVYDELSKYGYEMRALWASGFSWGRNGWGCTLSLILPFCFLLNKKSYTYIAWVVIFLSIFICGNRNGVLAASVSMGIFVISNSDNKSKKSTILMIILALMAVVLVFGFNGIYSQLRLGSGDISAGRSEQYLYIGGMIEEMGFFGLGYNGPRKYFLAHGMGDHAFHNAYINMFMQFGWPMLLILLVIVIKATKSMVYGLKSKNTLKVVLALVLLSGLMLSLFEPSVIFGSLGGYDIWWFAFGYLLNQYNASNNISIKR